MDFEITNEMEGILKQFGWADGFNIPVLNEENRVLMAEVSKCVRVCRTIVSFDVIIVIGGEEKERE